MLMSRSKLAIFLLLLTLVTASALTYAWSSGSLGFEIYETHTHAWHIDLGNVEVGSLKTFDVTVEYKEAAGEFLITYFIEITGPGTLCNNYLRLRWQDTDGADFTIGKDGDQRFSGTGKLTWNSSSPTVFETGHKNNITITLSFLTTAAIGKYNAKMWVTFTEKPIKATVDIDPNTLNLNDKGKWITCYIELPKGYDVRKIDVSSIRLNGTIPAEKTPTAIGDYGKDKIPDLMVKFDRAKVIQYILDHVNMVNLIKKRSMIVMLTITGKLNNGTPFQGSDTIRIILHTTRGYGTFNI